MKKRILSVFLVLAMLIGVAPIIPLGAVAASSNVWDGSVASSFAGGRGTEDSPYLIENGAQLAYMAKQVNSGADNGSYRTAYYKLTADIVLNEGDAANWATTAPANAFTPIGIADNGTNDASWRAGLFGGSFDGNGKTVSGVYVKNTSSSKNAGTGLFAIIGNNATVKNFRITNSYISANRAVGVIGLIRNATESLTVSGIYSEITVNAVEAGAGGIVGQLSGTGGASITDCVFNGAANSNGNYVAGIVGNCNGAFITVSSCLNMGAISGNAYVAGIATAEKNLAVTDCVNTGDVSATNGYCGDIYAGNLKESTVSVSGCYYTTALLKCLYSNNSAVSAENNTQIQKSDLLGNNATVPSSFAKRTGDIALPAGCTAAPSVIFTQEMVDGAAVRLGVPTGLRFMATIGKAYIESFGEGATFGIIIAPTDHVKEVGGVFTVDALNTLSHTDSYLKIPATDFMDGGDSDGFYTYSAIVDNVKAADYDKAFSAIAYVEANGAYYYSDYRKELNSRSIAAVADAACNDTSSVQSEEYPHTVSNGVYSPYKEEQRTMLSSFSFAPIEAGKAPYAVEALYYVGTDITTFTVGEDRYDIDCDAYLLKSKTLSDYNTLVTKLLETSLERYTDNGENGIEGECYQTTLYDSDYTVNVTFYTKTGELYMTVEDYRSLSPYQLAPTTAVKGTTTSFHMPELPTVNGSFKFGECEVFQLSSGHFIIVDGAQEFGAEPIVNYLYELTGGEMPIVDAWFITHAHPDHAYLIWGIGRDPEIVNRIRVDGFYYTWPNDKGVRRESDYSGLQAQIANVNGAMESFRDTDGNVTAKYKLHGGMRFYFGELEAQVLFTQDQIMPSEYNSFNDSSTSYKFIVRMEDALDVTFLMMGDASSALCKKIMKLYSADTLHTTFFQSLHHGYNDCFEFFKYIRPDYLNYTYKSEMGSGKAGYEYLKSTCKAVFCQPLAINLAEFFKES